MNECIKRIANTEPEVFELLSSILLNYHLRDTPYSTPKELTDTQKEYLSNNGFGYYYNANTHEWEIEL